MGQVIVFVNTKGGVGKSFLAVWLADSAFGVLVLDADDQQTAATHLKKISGHTVQVETIPRTDENAGAEEIRTKINDLRSGYDFIIVDTKGSAGLATSAAVIKADLALVPLQPSASDIWPIENALSVIRLSQEARNGLPKAALILILNQTEDS
jgi:chromosome partitioning protein